MPPSRSPHKDARQSRIDAWKVWSPMVLVVVLGFIAALLNLEPAADRHLSIAAGMPGGAYSAIAEHYRELLARQGFDLEVVATAGSMENLELLRRGRVTLGLIQGGTPSADDRRQLRSLASVFFEPVWVFFRRPLSIAELSDLAGRRIAIGSDGSGTQQLARELLADNGIDESHAQLLALSPAETVAAMAAGELDAALLVAAVDATYVHQLAELDGVELLSFRRHRAYHYRHPFLDRVVLGEGVLDLARNRPPEDTSLLAAAASLAARPDLHPDLIPLLLDTLKQVHGGDSLFAAAGTFPSPQLVELPLNDRARRYLVNGPAFLHRFLPYRLASEIDRLKILLLPFLTLLIPLFKIGPPLYRWRIRSRIYRWYEHLRLADDVLLEPSPDAATLASQIAELRMLEREVTEEVSVPLSYMDEFYRLREHIRMTLQQVEKRAAEHQAQSPTATPQDSAS